MKPALENSLGVTDEPPRDWWEAFKHWYKKGDPAAARKSSFLNAGRKPKECKLLFQEDSRNVSIRLKLRGC
jgi:hypothetical protein